MADRLMVGTRKGLIEYTLQNGEWIHQKTHFLGIPVNLFHEEPESKTWWACQEHGHWGCKLSRSRDFGESWEEVEAPKYPDGTIVKDDVPASTRYLWAFSNGVGSKSNHLFLGTEPGGLFESADGGDTWTLNEGLWNHPSRDSWFGGGRDYAGIHSIVVDPRDEDRILVGISVAGVFETTDGGKTWNPINKGLKADFLPDPHSEVGQDPHLLVQAASDYDTLWQQNHCGIFKSTDGGKNWSDVSENGGPAYFGFAVAVDEDDANIAYVVPGVSDVLRVAVDGALIVSKTTDGGSTWQSKSEGLPQQNVFDITYRHALDLSGSSLAFGTTTGNLYFSDDNAESWTAISHNLPMIYSVNLI